MSLTQVTESAALHALIKERDEARALLAGTLTGVTVVIPCYEQAEYLTESLESALAQTVQPLEVIIVDDGSTVPVRPAPPDKPAIPHLSRHDGGPYVQIHVLRVANRGLPSARNVGLMNARGHAFLPLDADDWLEPTYIEKTLPLLDAGADVVFAGLQEHGERSGRYVPGCGTPLESLTVEQERASNVLFYCALMRTSLLREAGGYNGRMINGYEDWDLWVDLMQRGAKLASVDEPLFNYRTRPDSMLARTEATWRDWNLDEMARHHGYKRPKTPIATRVRRGRSSEVPRGSLTEERRRRRYRQ